MMQEPAGSPQWGLTHEVRKRYWKLEEEQKIEHTLAATMWKIENVSNILYDLAKEMSRQNIENATYPLLAAYKTQPEGGQLKRELFSF